MSKIRLCTLYSGSGGNSTYVRCGDVRILIDAGKSARALEKAVADVGDDIRRISGIFVTHEHSDHTSALEIISKKYRIPVHITAGSANRAVREGSALSSVARVHPPVYSEKIGDVKVSSFVTPHDSILCVGYRISYGGESVGIATDVGYATEEITESLSGCRTVVIESNHDCEMVKTGPYPPELKHRILSNGGHLSNCDCARLSVRLAKSGTENIILAHLSKENNRPAIAKDAVESALSAAGASASVTVASPDEITFIEELVC